MSKLFERVFLISLSLHEIIRNTINAERNLHEYHVEDSNFEL